MTNNPRVLEYAHRRLESLQRLFKTQDGVRWNLRLFKEGHQHKGEIYHAEAQIKTAKKNFGADASGSTPYEAIDALKQDLTKKITTNKDKKITRTRRGALRAKELLRKGK